MNTKNVLQGTTVAIIAYVINPKLDSYKIILLGLVAASLFAYIEYQSNYQGLQGLQANQYKELFEDFNDDDSRVVRYGDIVGIKTWKGSYLSKCRSGNCELGVDDIGVFESIENLHKPSGNDLLVIEDPLNAGNNNPIKYSNKVVLRAYNMPKYIYISDENNVEFRKKERSNISSYSMTLFADDTTNNKLVKYGDRIYIKSGSKYLRTGDSINITLGDKNGSEPKFNILDRYGQDNKVDWARRGEATQSSIYQDYYASNAIDGNISTYNQTNPEKNAWWEVKLPKNTLINSIRIRNRQGANDEEKRRLDRFNILIYDSNRNELLRNDFDSTTVSENIEWKDDGGIIEWNNINKVGRIIRIQLKNTNTLHISGFEVFGETINHSILLEKPLSSDLLKRMNINNSNVQKLISNQDIPQSSTGYTYSFIINPNSSMNDVNNFKNILIKGNGNAKTEDKNRSIGVWIHPDSMKLRVFVSTKNNKNSGIDGTETELAQNKSSHISVVVGSGINRFSSWSSHNTGEEKMAKPTMKLYVDGVLVNTVDLGDELLTNNSPLYINKDGNYRGSISNLKVFNYPVNQENIQRLARSKYSRVSKDIVQGIQDSSNVFNEPHALLPAYNNNYSVSLWMRSNQEFSREQRRNVLSKNNEFNLFVDLSDVFNLHISLRNGQKDKLRLRYNISKGTWVHVCVIKQDKKIYLHIGDKTKVLELSDDAVKSSNKLNIGGFVGNLKDVKFYNYAISKDEIKSLRAFHPESSLNEELHNIFKKVGCTGIPFNLINNPDGAQEEKELLRNKKNLELEKRILKAKTDPKTKKEKQIQAMCLGESMGSVGSTGSFRKKCPEGPKCLPTAPYRCPKEKSINSFDITTHRDFHKYIDKSKVKKCPVNTQRPLNQLNQLNPVGTTPPVNPLELIAGIKDNKTLKDIADVLKTRGIISLERLVSETKDVAVLRNLVLKLLKNNKIKISEITNTMEPSELLALVKNLIKTEKLPVSQIIDLLKNKNELNRIIKNMINNGEITKEELLKNIRSSNVFKQLLKNECSRYKVTQDTIKKQIDMNYLPDNYKDHPIYKVLLKKRLSEFPIKQHPDIANYIGKESGICYGCKDF